MQAYRAVNVTPIDCDTYTQAGRSDFAANAGNLTTDELSGGPPYTLLTGDADSYAWPSTTNADGVIYQRSEIRYTDIRGRGQQHFPAGREVPQPGLVRHRHRRGGQREPVRRLRQRQLAFRQLRRRCATRPAWPTRFGSAAPTASG